MKGQYGSYCKGEAHSDRLRSFYNKLGRYLVLHHRARVLVDVAVDSEPVETGVVRVAVVVQHTQLHQAPSLHARHRQPERLIKEIENFFIYLKKGRSLPGRCRR